MYAIIICTFFIKNRKCLRIKRSFDVLQINNLHLVFLVIYILNCILVGLSYWGNLSGILSKREVLLQETNIYHAFGDSRFIFVGIIINVATAFTSGMDLLFDVFDYYYYHGDSDDHCYISLPERIFLILLNIVTGLIILSFSGDENIPYLYTTIHSLQFSGSMDIILLLCKNSILLPIELCLRRSAFPWGL